MDVPGFILFQLAGIFTARGPLPLNVIERIVTYQGEALWKRRLGVIDPGHAYILVLGKNGRIRWRSATAFSGFEFGDLVRSVLEQLRNVRLQ